MKKWLSILVFFTSISFSIDISAADRQIGDWIVSDRNGFYETYTGNESGSTLGLLCTSERCDFYFRSSTKCESDGTYLVLINSENGASSQRLTCVPLTIEGKKEFVMLIGDIESFASTVLNSSTVGIAIPMASGQFKVSRFSLRGASKALEVVVELRKKGASAKPSNRQGLSDSTL